MSHLQKQIDEIMEEFDFEKVHKTMQFLGWKWAGSVGIPTIEDLRKQAKDLLERVCSRDFWGNDDPSAKYYWTGVGGLMARRVEDISPYPNGGGRLSLEFILTDWDCEYDLEVVFKKEIEKQKKKDMSAFDGLTL